MHGIETANLSAGEIDAAVRAAADAGTPLYQLDEAAFNRCEPDLVLTQDLCRVCALPAGEVETALAHLGCSAKVVSHDPHTLEDVLASIAVIAHAAGVADKGAQFVSALKKRLANVRASVSGVAKPTVFVLEWTDPPFLSGHWVPDVIAAAGARPVLAKAGERSTATTWEAIIAARPDVVLVAPCGFDLEGAVAQATAILDHLPKSAEVWAIDANALMVRPGPRLIDAVEQLAAVFHDIGAPDRTLVARIR